MTAVALAVAGWFGLAGFAVCLGKAAARPAPKPERDRPLLIALDDVTFDWPMR